MLVKIRKDIQKAMLSQLINVKEEVHILQQDSLERLQSQALKQQQLQGRFDLIRHENDKLKQQIGLMERDQQALNDSVRTCDELSRENQYLVT